LRQASKVVFCFDGDAAGRKAAWRALEASLEQLTDDRSVGFLFLPAEHDPDSFVRAEGAAAFRQLADHPTTLIEFLMRELGNGLDLERSLEDRARLVHEAKPHLQKLAAPALRVQLTKAVARAADMTQAEVEGLCNIKPPARGRPPPPRPRNRSVAMTLEHALLEPVLYKPERAARIPLERVPGDHPEGALLHAIANAVDHGELPAGGFGMLIEFFRGTPHETTLAALTPMIAQDEPDPGELETVFVDAIDRLRQKDISRELAAGAQKARDGNLSAEELRELIARKAQSQKSPSSE
jgi:DNA primase